MRNRTLMTIAAIAALVPGAADATRYYARQHLVGGSARNEGTPEPDPTPTPDGPPGLVCDAPQEGLTYASWEGYAEVGQSYDLANAAYFCEKSGNVDADVCLGSHNKGGDLWTFFTARNAQGRTAANWQRAAGSCTTKPGGGTAVHTPERPKTTCASFVRDVYPVQDRGLSLGYYVQGDLDQALGLCNAYTSPNTEQCYAYKGRSTDDGWYVYTTAGVVLGAGTGGRAESAVAQCR